MRAARSSRRPRPYDAPLLDRAPLVLDRKDSHEPFASQLGAEVLDRLGCEPGLLRDARVERVGLELALRLENVEEQAARVAALGRLTLREQRLYVDAAVAEPYGPRDGLRE